MGLLRIYASVTYFLNVFYISLGLVWLGLYVVYMSYASFLETYAIHWSLEVVLFAHF